MKQRMSTNGRFSRVLFTVLTVAFALCILTFTSSAANTLTETSMTYDFSNYSGNNDAVLAGWRVQGQVPSGTNKSANVSVSANMVGVTDLVTRDGAGIYENLEFVYTVPQNDRITLSEYDVVTFSRDFENADGFVRTGAEYQVILVTDGGDRVEISLPWITKSETYDLATVTVEAQDKLEALDGDAVLTQIIFKPYANPEEFALDVVEEAQTLLQFYVGHIAFLKAVDMPVVSAEPDTYDGLSVTEHTGKITGLNPSLTYEYKLTYGTEWTKVSGKSEITGLEGATWRIRQAADEKNGLLASRAVAVDVPRTVHDLMNYGYDRVANNDYNRATGTSPVIGTWVSTVSSPYSASGRITISSDLSWLSGSTAYNSAVAGDEGAYYRRLINVFDYALKPEEQIDISAAYFSFGITCSASFPYSSYDDVVATMLIYVSGQEEPLEIPNLRYSSSTKTYSLNLGATFPDATGNIERIVFVPWHTHTLLPTISNNYPQISDIIMTEILPAPAPTVFAVDMEDGTYKISGFKASRNYEMSADGATWTQLPAGTTSLTGITEGVYYFRQMASDDYLTGEVLVINLFDQRREKPSGLMLSGRSIKGLDSSLKYEYAPYNIAGDFTWTSVSGTTSIDSLSSGLWAVRFPAEGDFFASENVYFFIDGSSKKGDVNVVAQEKGSAVRGWVAGEIASDVAAICYYNSTGTVTSSLVMWAGWEKTTDMFVNSSLNVTYAFTYDQVFDIKELYRFSYKAGFAGSGFYLNGNNLTGFYNKIRFYVVNSDVEYYDVYTPWSKHNSKIDANVGSLLPADAHGQVVGYKFYYYGQWPEISSELPSEWPFPLYTVYDLTLGSEVAAPKPTVTYNADQTFTVSGLKSTLAHGYSTDGKNFVELGRGVTSFTVKTPGTYYIYAQNTTSGMKSRVVSIEARVDGSAAATGLSVVGNSIQGFNTNLSYEYRKYSLTEENEYTTLTAGAVRLEGLTAGLWEVRYVTETGDAKPAYYLVYGENNGTIALKANYNPDGDKWDGNTGFAAGRWTSSSDNCYLSSSQSASTVCLATVWNSSLEQEDLDAFYFSYQFTDDEIIPIADVKPIKYYTAFGNTNPYSNPSTTRVRYYVAGGDVDYYDVTTTFTYKGADTTNDLSTVAPEGAPGYIVGIRIWPHASYSEDTTLLDTINRYPVLKIYGYDTGETDPRLMSRIIVGQVRPQELVLEEADTNLYQKYKITGFDADKLYEYSVDGTNWKALSEGTTELGPLVGGTYYVRYAATSTLDASEAVIITTPTMTPAFITTDISYFPSVIAQDFREGFWTAYPSNVDTNTNEFTSYIGSTTPLNTVRYAYTFSPEHRFTVNEYPYFVLDFNNSAYNMGIDSSYIQGAQMEVDIYFVGITEPYTVTGEWAGHHRDSTGFTANKILVDLLSVSPEYGNYTVRAIVIRPYANITTTPADYNTSSTESHYIYFRVWNVGFYSTEENIAAINSATHEQVNRFEGITLVPQDGYADDGEITEDEFTVIAHYSDGTEKQVDSSMVAFDIPTLGSVGIYSVTASYRGASDSESLILGIVTDSIEIFSLPKKTLYYVGEMFNADGLSFNYTTVDGDVVNVTSGYTVVPTIFETSGEVEIPVYYGGREFSIKVEIVPDGYELTLAKDSSYTFDTDVRRIYGVSELTTVADIIASFTGSVHVFDRAGNDITAQTEAVIGSDFTVATLVDGNIADYGKIVIKGDINGNGKIDTNDFILIKRAYLNAFVLSEGSLAFEAADVNGNGSIDTNDYLQIKNHCRGRIDLFN